MDQLNIPQFNPSQTHSCQFSQNFTEDINGSKRMGIPPSSSSSSHSHHILPISPCSEIMVSQPTVFSLDSLHPLTPSQYRNSSSSASMQNGDVGACSLLSPSHLTKENYLRTGECLSPCNAHRRSNSDIPFGFSSLMQQSFPPIAPIRGLGGLELSMSGAENLGLVKPAQLVQKKSSLQRVSDNNVVGELVDDLFLIYMNSDNIDVLNSLGTDDKNEHENCEELGRASGIKTGDNSVTEAESNVNESGGSIRKLGLNIFNDKREVIRRSAWGDIAPTSRHRRSVSMDCFKGKLQFGDELHRLPPSLGTPPGQVSPSNSTGAPSNSIDANLNAFSSEFRYVEFSEAEMKNIMANEKLSGIALTDPKRAKRILANSQSAVRSKERKMRYISELKQKVQTLETEVAILNAQLTLLKGDFDSIRNETNELKFRLQAMEQQEQLLDALNEALTWEVRHLKIATTHLND
ncbi:hypothetical protein COP2_035303 [Malus domestica]